MNYKEINWSKDEYNNFINSLYNYQDIKYRDFHHKLLGTSVDLIGIRTPILKKIAKEISLSDYQTFFKFNKHILYEENTIEGLVIGYIKAPFNDIENYILDMIPYINNWATCDLMCSNLKIFKKFKYEGFRFINKIIKSDNPWSIRVGVVLLLDYYITDEYLNDVFNIIDNIKSDEYYVNMAISWLISYCYINNPLATKNYLKEAKISKFTYNKAIQKIIESYRVNIEEKNDLRKLKK